jgi:hypothetical protein
VCPSVVFWLAPPSVRARSMSLHLQHTIASISMLPVACYSALFSHCVKAIASEARAYTAQTGRNKASKPAASNYKRILQLSGAQCNMTTNARVTPWRVQDRFRVASAPHDGLIVTCLRQVLCSCAKHHCSMFPVR